MAAPQHTFDINPLSSPAVLDATFRTSAPAGEAERPAGQVLPSRSRRRRAKKHGRTTPATATATAAERGGEEQEDTSGQLAPWIEDSAADAAEEREARKAALRKAIAARRQQRTGKHALSTQSKRQQQQQQEGEGGEGGGGIEAALSQLDPSQFSPAALAAAAAKLGIPASQIPSKRALMRKLGTISTSELMAASAGSAALRR